MLVRLAIFIIPLLVLPSQHARAEEMCAMLFARDANTGSHPRGSERQRPQQEIPYALLPNGRQIAPTGLVHVYHGTRRFVPTTVLWFGMPGRGNNFDLLAHSNGAQDSAFRGATLVVSDPSRETGAAYWAGEGGWVFEIVTYAFDVNLALEGRVKRGLQYGANDWRGENEYAIPAAVSPDRVVRYGQVQVSASGKLYVPQWIQNPNFIPPRPKHHSLDSLEHR